VTVLESTAEEVHEVLDLGDLLRGSVRIFFRSVCSSTAWPILCTPFSAADSLRDQGLDDLDDFC